MLFIISPCRLTVYCIDPSNNQIYDLNHFVCNQNICLPLSQNYCRRVLAVLRSGFSETPTSMLSIDWNLTGTDTGRLVYGLARVCHYAKHFVNTIYTVIIHKLLTESKKASECHGLFVRDKQQFIIFRQFNNLSIQKHNIEENEQNTIIYYIFSSSTTLHWICKLWRR